MYWVDIAHAMAPGAQGGAQGGGGALMGMMPLIIMFVIFYFLLIRPQQKKAKAHKQMLAELGVGHYVLTNGGIYGRITSVEGDILNIELADNLEIKVNRGFVSSMVENPFGKQKKKEG